jgi:hypothetical protein
MRLLLATAAIAATGAAVGLGFGQSNVMTPPTQLVTESEAIGTSDALLPATPSGPALEPALVTLGDLPGYVASGYDPSQTANKLCPFVAASVYTGVDRVSAGFQEPVSGRMAAQTITRHEPGLASTFLDAVSDGAQDCHEFSDDMGAWTVTSSRSGTSVTVTMDATDQGIAIDIQYTQVGNVIITSMTAGWEGHDANLVTAMTVKAASRLG